jgi:hypothetical protein
VRGLLNRISESNLEPLCNEAVTLYGGAPAAEVTRALLSAAVESLAHETQVLPAHCMTVAALLGGTAVLTGARANVHDPVSSRDCFLIVLDDNQSIAHIA